MKAPKTLNSDQLTSNTLTIDQRSDLIVDTVVTMMERSMVGWLRNVPGLKVTTYNADDPEVKLSSGKKGVTTHSIKQFQIDTGDRVRYFKRVASTENMPEPQGDDPVSTAVRRALDAKVTATAWRETEADGTLKKHDENKPDIIFSFPGFTHKEFKAFSVVLARGVLDPKSYVAPAFIKQTLDKAQAEGEDITKAHVVGCSMGTASAVLAKRFLLLADVPTTPMTALEPYGVSMALDIINRDLHQPASLLSKTLTASLPKEKQHTFAAEAKRLAHPDMSFEHDRSYRTVVFGKKSTDADDRKIHCFSRVANISVIAPQGRKTNNEMIGQPLYIDMTGVSNITPGMLGIIDPLHMNGNIAKRLIEENEAAIIKLKGSTITDRRSSEHDEAPSIGALQRHLSREAQRNTPSEHAQGPSV